MTTDQRITEFHGRMMQANGPASVFDQWDWDAYGEDEKVDQLAALEDPRAATFDPETEDADEEETWGDFTVNGFPFGTFSLAYARDVLDETGGPELHVGEMGVFLAARDDASLKEFFPNDYDFGYRVIDGEIEVGQPKEDR